MQIALSSVLLKRSTAIDGKNNRVTLLSAESLDPPRAKSVCLAQLMENRDEVSFFYSDQRKRVGNFVSINGY